MALIVCVRFACKCQKMAALRMDLFHKIIALCHFNWIHEHQIKGFCQIRSENHQLLIEIIPEYKGKKNLET